MSDTIRVIHWTLERPCCFRTHEEWNKPGRDFWQLHDLRSITAALQDNRLINGICVNSWTTAKDQQSNIWEVPLAGFRIDKHLQEWHGLPPARSICGACEANTPSDLQPPVGGCAGYFYNFTELQDFKEVELTLQSIIRDRNLEDAYLSNFPPTNPLSLGFWINSPLRRAQAELLRMILGDLQEQLFKDNSQLQHFLNALDVAIRCELPLHVLLTPPGHCDLGWSTTFPHCPRCKAGGPFRRWQETYPATPHQCAVCGHAYIPAETQHSEEESEESVTGRGSLDRVLGPIGYTDFIKAYNLHRGCTPQQAEEILDSLKRRELLQQITLLRSRRKDTLQSLRAARRTSSADHSSSLTLSLPDHATLKLVFIPAGEFVMGDPHLGNASPPHLVRIPHPFYMGCTPVTRAQWSAVMETAPPPPQEANLPVDQVNWLEAQHFCQKLALAQRLPIRLPTEAEWEYACRAGSTTRFTFGDTLLASQATFAPSISVLSPSTTSRQSLTDQASDQPAESQAHYISSPHRPTHVGIHPPNAWGLFDMHGNVAEWCEDVWHPHYENAPADAVPWITGTVDLTFRVMRGGACTLPAPCCSSAARHRARADSGSPVQLGPLSEFETLLLNDALESAYLPHGFRIACEI